MTLRYQMPVAPPAASPGGLPQMRRVHYRQTTYTQFATASEPSPTLAYAEKGKSISRSTLLLCGLAVVISTTTLGLVFSSHRSPLPSVSAAASFEMGPLASVGKSAFLSSVQQAKQRDLAGKVHFVAELIRRTQPNVKRPKQLARAIVEESKAAGYDPLFVAAVIKAESTFRRTARSHKGAVGLMQLLPSTARYISRKRDISWRGVSTLSEAGYNVRLGISYLQYLEGMYDGNRKKALIAYNWGPSKLMQSLKRGGNPPRSTLRYANKILADYTKWTGNYLDRYEQYRFFNINYLGS